MCVLGESRNPTGLFSRPKVSRPTPSSPRVGSSLSPSTALSAQKMLLKQDHQRDQQTEGERTTPGITGRRVTKEVTFSHLLVKR